MIIINPTEQQINCLFLQLFIRRVSVLKSVLELCALQVCSRFPVWILLRKMYFKTLEQYFGFYSLQNFLSQFVRIDLVYSDTVKPILIFYLGTLKPRSSTHLNFYRKCILTLQVYQIFKNQQVLQTKACLEISKL